MNETARTIPTPGAALVGCAKDALWKDARRGTDWGMEEGPVLAESCTAECMAPAAGGLATLDGNRRVALPLIGNVFGTAWLPLTQTGGGSIEGARNITAGAAALVGGLAPAHETSTGT
jgi:hypothetical protein